MTSPCSFNKTRDSVVAMLDIRMNGTDYPDVPLDFCFKSRWLCLAPHPDDEVIGSGGTLMLAARAGADVHVVIVTDGSQGFAGSEGLNIRQQESCSAAQIMGLPSPEFFHIEDRKVRFTCALTTQIQGLLELHQPTHLILPALSEPHPDHQALALCAAHASLKANLKQDLTLLFSEIGAPTQPNTLVDISEVAEKKWQAMTCFASQEALHPYLKHAQALSTLRSLGKGPSCEAAEAFWQVNLKNLKVNGWSTVFPHWPLQRAAIGLVNTSNQLPLVNILIRSMGRDTLKDALASISVQTYPNLEVIVVNATENPHPDIDWPKQRFNLRLIESSKPLTRSEAANVALENVKGEMAIFLDDDDLIEPDHVEKLVESLQANLNAIAAYTGVRVIDNNGNTVRTYDVPWSPQRLAGINYLPIHAVLFRAWPIQKHRLFFDTLLPVLEDWDFWFHLSSYGSMVHVSGASGVYRQGMGQSMLGQQDHPHHWRLWHEKILKQRIEKATKDQLLDWLKWHALSLDQSDAEISKLQQRLASAIEDYAEKQEQHQLLLDQYSVREVTHREIANKLQEAQESHRQLLDQYARREEEHREIANKLQEAQERHRQLLDQYARREEEHREIARKVQETQQRHQHLVELYAEREERRRELASQLQEVQESHQQLLDLYAARENDRQRTIEQLNVALAENGQMLLEISERNQRQQQLTQQHQILMDNLTALQGQYENLVDLYEQRESDHKIQHQELEQISKSYNSLVDLYGERERHHGERLKEAELIVKALEDQLDSLRQNRWVKWGGVLGVVSQSKQQS